MNEPEKTKIDIFPEKPSFLSEIVESESDSDIESDFYPTNKNMIYQNVSKQFSVPCLAVERKYNRCLRPQKSIFPRSSFNSIEKPRRGSDYLASTKIDDYDLQIPESSYQKTIAESYTQGFSVKFGKDLDVKVYQFGYDEPDFDNENDDLFAVKDIPQDIQE